MLFIECPSKVDRSAHTTMVSYYFGGTGPNSEVVLQKVSNKAIITLNRPKALNTLNLSMVNTMASVMRDLQSQDDLKLIIIKGAGEKAFCAGGDVKAVTDLNLGDAKCFFRSEYYINHAIGTTKIPWVALIDGITMGGGAGVSVHGHFRVATERTMFAMPETAIGLIPDVGGGYFLPRLPGGLGNFLALTGYRLRGRDVYSAGIATHFVESQKIPELEKDLTSLKSPTLKDVEDVLNHYHGMVALDKEESFSLSGYQSIIDNIFSSYVVEDIINQLEEEGSEWSKQQIKTMKKMSPTSIKLTMEQLRRGKVASLKEVLQMEYRVVMRILQDSDFREGVRALLVDKDLSPKWKPSTLEEVTRESIDAHFEVLPANEELDL